MLHVDHSYYKLRRGEKEDDFLINYDEVRKELEASEDDKKKKEEKEEKDLKLIESGEAKPKAIALEFKSENKEKKEEVMVRVTIYNMLKRILYRANNANLARPYLAP